MKSVVDHRDMSGKPVWNRERISERYSPMLTNCGLQVSKRDRR